MHFDLLLAGISAVVIIALAFYAGILISKIKTQTAQNLQKETEQKAQAALKKQQRNDSICESIRVIARATTQKQCNVSEAAIRLTVLLETLLLEKAIDIADEYPALSELFDKVKEMPTHDRRKEVAIKALKMLDRQRQLFEAELEPAIIKEALQLQNFSL